MDDYLTEIFSGLIAFLIAVLIMYFRSFSKSVEKSLERLAKDQRDQWSQIGKNRENIGRLLGPSNIGRGD